MLVLVASVLVTLNPGSALTLEQALRALQAEQPIAGKVSREVSLEAVGRIRRPRGRLTKDQLEHLVAVARAGAAERALAHSMVAHIASHGVTHGVALTTLTSAPSSVLEEALQRPPSSFSQQLHRLVQASEGDERLVGEALWLLAPGLDPKRAATWLERWFGEKPSHPRAAALLRETGRTGSPQRLLPLLATLQPAPELRRALAAALSVLVLRDEATAALALELAGEPEASAELLRSLGSVPGWLRRKAKAVLLEHVRAAHDLLSSEDAAAASLAPEAAERAAAAIAAGAELLIQELGEMLPLLARRGPLEMRTAAIRAIPSILYRDQATLGLLIRLLRDEQVAVEAHRCLLRKSGARLPRQPELWERWLRGQPLQASEPGEARAVRLEQAWKLVAVINERRSAALQRHARWKRTLQRPAPAPRARARKATRAPPSAADTWQRLDKQRRDRLAGVGRETPAPEFRWRTWTALGIAGLCLLLLWRWSNAAGGGDGVRLVELEAKPREDPVLALIPTSRWARRLQQMRAERRRASNTARVLARAEEARLLEEFLAGLERLRQAEQQDERERRAVAHVAFSTASFSRARLVAIRGDATVPVQVLFPDEPEAGTASVGALFSDPVPTPRDETVPVAELFPDAGGAGEEPNTGTAAVADLFPEPAAACPRDGTTVKVADLFPDGEPSSETEESSETVPIQELFSEAPPAEECEPGSSDTVAVDDLFDRSAEGARE